MNRSKKSHIDSLVKRQSLGEDHIDNEVCRVLAELPRTQVHQAGGSLAIANGSLVVETGITGSCYRTLL